MEERVQLPIIPVVIFDTFPSLNYVKLNNAELLVILQMDFQNANKLCSLDLQHNKIQFIPADVFLFAKHLRTLDLSYNEINDLAHQSISTLNNLRTLNLNYNKINILRKHSFSGSINLEYLSIMSNDLEVIEDEALNLPHLIEIIFRSNRLKSLCNNLFHRMSNIHFIDFGYNELITIGEAFQNIDSIRSLNLEGNPLEHMNLTAFVAMHSLVQLSLNDSKFKVVTPNTGASQRSVLTQLSLANNNLSHGNIFESLSVFPKLKILFLNNNRFEQLPPITSIKNMLPNIRVINLVNNNQICDWYSKNNIAAIKLQVHLVVGNCAY